MQIYRLYFILLKIGLDYISVGYKIATYGTPPVIYKDMGNTCR